MWHKPCLEKVLYWQTGLLSRLGQTREAWGHNDISGHITISHQHSLVESSSAAADVSRSRSRKLFTSSSTILELCCNKLEWLMLYGKSLLFHKLISWSQETSLNFLFLSCKSQQPKLDPRCLCAFSDDMSLSAWVLQPYSQLTVSFISHLWTQNLHFCGHSYTVSSSAPHSGVVRRGCDISQWLGGLGLEQHNHFCVGQPFLYLHVKCFWSGGWDS